jgi:dTDP-4-dehydrorhamnose 3,5-epimerase
LYVPIGVAHGFQCISNTCSVLYFVNGPYVSSHDVGIRYDSFEMKWPIAIGDMSDRDQRFPVLNQFDSPFSYVA